MEAKPLKYKELKGISEKQLKEHHDVLYAGYVKKINEIREKLKTADRAGANATYSEIRALKLEESFALNGVVLHEAYFDSLGGDGKPKGVMLDLIKEDFGSYESWKEDLVACGISSRGWVVLAYDWNDGKLHNYVCDMHNQGGIWGCSMLIVLDVYEHAYFIDYATGRKAYIEAFLNNLDFTRANKYIENSRLLENRKMKR